MREIIYILLFFSVFTYAKSGDDKTISLVTSGQGKTQDEAKQNALRNAIEQAFGAFISSHTEVVNDNLVKDEIISVSNGNIQKYEILSEILMPDGSFSSVVKATVSLEKLTRYCESKGITVEFKGALFAANIKLEQLKEENTNAVIKNMCYVVSKLIDKGCFDYMIEVKEPEKEYGIWRVQILVRATPNENMKNIKNFIQNVRNGIGGIYGKHINYYQSLFMYNLPLSSLNFQVSDGITNYKSITLLEQIYRGHYGHYNNVSIKDQGMILTKNSVLSIGNQTGTENKTDISCELLEMIHNQSDFQRIKTKNFDYSFPDPYQHYYDKITIDYRNLDKINFDFYFSLPYSLETLSKITEFKVYQLN